MKRGLILIVFLGFLTSLSAEVIFLRSGEILFGDIVSAGSGTITISTFGQEKQILSTDIVRTEPSLSALADLVVQVILKDGTIIKGKIVDFDEEIGVFVDISFGNLAVPSAAVEKIVDPARAASSAPASQWLGVGGGVSFPLSKDFGMSWGAGVGWEFHTPWLTGLNAGLTLTYDSLAYTTNSQISFANIGLSAYTVYIFNGLLQGMDLFAPYAGLGAGAVIVQAFDKRPDAAVDQRGLLTGFLSAHLGLEWRLPARFLLRTGGGLDMVLQTDGVFLVPKAGLGFYFGF